MDWKQAVATYSDIATTYPNPQDGWTVNVQDTDYTYRYDGSLKVWIPISANSIPIATESVDGKMSKEDKTKLDGIQANAQVNPTASDILTSLKTVDGTGSGLDANLLDGQGSSYYLNYSNFSNVPDVYTKTEINTQMNGKVSTISGKSLSTNDFDNTYRSKIDGISINAKKVSSSTTNGNIQIDDVETTVYTHPGTGTNPHGTTKSDVGLGNVTNDAQVKRTEMAIANGVATLDSNGINAQAPKAHTHTKSQITDFPLSMPANGGTSSFLGNAINVLDYNTLNPNLIAQGNITPIKADAPANSPWNNTTAGFLVQSNDSDSFHVLIFRSGGDGWAYRSYYQNIWSTWKIWSIFSGSYTDLTNQPTIPTKTSQLTNDGNGTNNFATIDLINTINTIIGTVTLSTVDKTLRGAINELKANISSGGTVDNANKLNGQTADYYLNFNNQTNKPTTLGGYGITNASLSTHNHTSLSTQTAILNMGGNKITNIADGSSNTDVVSLGQVNTLLSNATSGSSSSLHTPVADLASCKAITSSSRLDKMLLNVESLGLYRWDAESTVISDDNEIIRPTDISSDSTAGRWIKMNASIDDHNNLCNIQGGTTGQYYHLTSTQVSLVNNASQNGHTHTSANITDATNTNTASMIVKRDSSGNFSAGIISATLNGNATTASKLTTARTITITGDATGSTTFDGSGNSTITINLVNNEVEVGTYKSVTVDAKGRVIAGTNPTTLTGYGITDGVSKIEIQNSVQNSSNQPTNQMVGGIWLAPI